MKINLRYISGISVDYIKVTSNDSSHPIDETYTFGYDCSYNRRNAETDKPYIGDILADLVETNHIQEEDIEYSCYYVFPQKELSVPEAIQKFNELFSEI